MQTGQSPITFIGKVEDIADPLELGRVRVRVLGYHDATMTVEDLDWVNVLQPTSSTGVSGAGMSSTWLRDGATVVGMYLDGANRSLAVIFGSLNQIPDDDLTRHGVHKLARGDADRGRLPNKQEEPEAGASTYPNNHVISTPGGHIIELDDTEGNQRVGIQHSSGSYIEVSNSGAITIRAGDNLLSSVDGDSKEVIDGDKNIVAGSLNIHLEGPAQINAGGSCIVSGKTVTIKGSKVSIVK